MARQTPDDLPPPREPSSEVDALVAAGPPGPNNPVTVAAVFWTAVTEPAGPDLEVLRIVVTPESWADWGNFGRPAALLPAFGMASQAMASVDDPHVVYVRYLRETGAAMPAPSHAVPAGDVLVGTLVHRPLLGGWRVHALGGHVRPELVPHDPS